jgi:predicted tellurium resistance membrane protein TerC
MDRFPIIVLLGGMLLGWIGGGIGVDDPIITRFAGELPPYTHYVGAVVGALFVLIVGKVLMAGKTAVKK